MNILSITVNILSIGLWIFILYLFQKRNKTNEEGIAEWLSKHGNDIKGPPGPMGLRGLDGTDGKCCRHCEHFPCKELAHIFNEAYSALLGDFWKEAGVMHLCKDDLIRPDHHRTPCPPLENPTLEPCQNAPCTVKKGDEIIIKPVCSHSYKLPESGQWVCTCKECDHSPIGESVETPDGKRPVCDGKNVLGRCKFYSVTGGKEC